MRLSGRRFLVGGSGRRWLATGLAGCSVVASILMPSPVAAVAPAVTASDTPDRAVAPQPTAAATPTEAADDATAIRLAYRHRRPVEVLAERTESSQTFAQPDGTLHLRQFATPRWVSRGGEWVPVDTTLRFAGGAVVPGATTLDLRFSAGGTGPLLTFARDGHSVSLSWPRPLPAPRLSGDTATYPDVLPDVDLQVSAGVDAFSQLLVVKTAQAAADPELAVVRYAMATDGVTMRQDAATGFIRAVDAAGQAVFVSDGARMWDSPASAGGSPAKKPAGTTSSDPAPAADPRPEHSETVPVRLSAGALEVLPPAAMLHNPQVNFPLYIDPGFNGGKEIWTHVNRKEPNRSFWTDKDMRDSMRSGQVWHGTSDDDWRTLVQFDIKPLKGATTVIKEASVLVVVGHTADCARSPFQLWQTNRVSTSSPVTWNNTKDKWWKRLAEVKATANKQACPKGDDEVEFGNKAVADAFQYAARKSYETITFAFRAKSESDEFQWKRLVPGSAYLDVTYDRPPLKPTDPGFSPCHKACSPTAAVTSSRRPSLAMAVKDPDGGTLRYEFMVYDSAKKSIVVQSKTQVTGVASGKKRAWTVTKDLPDGRYYWRGKGCASGICGPLSDWYGFTVDAANPTLPSVSSEKYKPAGWHGGPGVPGEFIFKPGATADGVQTYYYSLNGGKEEPVKPDGSGVGKATVTPTRDMESVLRVSAVDAAGNRSAAVDYPFWVNPGGDAWYWSLDEDTGSAAASAPVNNRPATVSGSGVTWSAPGKQGSAGLATFTGAGELSTQHPVVDTMPAKGFTVAAWVRLPASEPVDSSDDPPTGGGEPASDGPGDDPDSEDTPPDTPPDHAPDPVPPHNQTAVSEDGANASMFRLGYRNDLDVDGDQAPDPAWCFTIKAADSATAAETTACTTDFVVPGDWVHLVGVVDRANGKVRLYVNGLPRYGGVLVEVTGTTTWQAAGRFAIGRAWAGGTPAERWVGNVDEVHAAPRIWSDQEIHDKATEPGEQAASAATS
jgi:hypothetical protein